MRSGQRIAVVIPALNEEQSLGHVLAAIPAWADDVIVADNGSTDATAEVARRAGVTVVSEPSRGYGAACMAGIRAAAAADVVVFLDADFSDHPEQMDRLVDPIIHGDADLVVGSRTLGRRQRGALTPQQRVGNALACRLIRAGWGFAYTDLGPFRAIRADALQRLQMTDRTYGWTVQMQVRALRANLRVAEAPVDYRRRIGRSKISGTLTGVVRAGSKIISTIVVERLASPRSPRWPAREHVILFTRCPEAGAVKTRLIPALGPDGAAELHRRMTLHSLAVVDRAVDPRGGSAEVRFAGGDRGRMAALFGDHRAYRRQAAGDLGQRLRAAMFEAFARGARSVVAVGSDCPDLAPELLAGALDALRAREAVIGPARDGGYYLLGLRTPHAELFADIDWGTPAVYQQTLEQAAGIGLSPHRLPELRDVDEPEDQPVWEAARDRYLRGGRLPRLSVIIPTLNEEKSLPGAIASVPRDRDTEIIVADGGSTDATLARAESLGAAVVRAPRGRGAQMNAGAGAARGRLLLFLHADTRLPPDSRDEIERMHAQPGVALTAFRLQIEPPSRALDCIARLANLRSCLLGMPYGDQALAVRASLFRRLGGFREWPLMEDFDLVRRARRHGAVICSRSATRTSARRWQRHGVLRTVAANQLCVLGHLLRVSPSRLARLRESAATSG